MQSIHDKEREPRARSTIDQQMAQQKHRGSVFLQGTFKNKLCFFPTMLAFARRGGTHIFNPDTLEAEGDLAYRLAWSTE